MDFSCNCNERNGFVISTWIPRGRNQNNFVEIGSSHFHLLDSTIECFTTIWQFSLNFCQFAGWMAPIVIDAVDEFRVSNEIILCWFLNLIVDEGINLNSPINNVHNLNDVFMHYKFHLLQSWRIYLLNFNGTSSSYSKAPGWV